MGPQLYVVLVQCVTLSADDVDGSKLSLAQTRDALCLSVCLCRQNRHVANSRLLTPPAGCGCQTKALGAQTVRAFTQAFFTLTFHDTHTR